MWRRTEETFPKISQILGKYRELREQTAPKFHACGECKDGWRFNVTPGKKFVGRVVRCQCFLDYVRFAKGGEQ